MFLAPCQLISMSIQKFHFLNLIDKIGLIIKIEVFIKINLSLFELLLREIEAVFFQYR